MRHDPRVPLSSNVKVTNSMPALFRRAIAGVFGAITANKRCARAPRLPFALRAMLSFGVAACIVTQHVAMPPRQPCTALTAPSGIAGCANKSPGFGLRLTSRGEPPVIFANTREKAAALS